MGSEWVRQDSRMAKLLQGPVEISGQEEVTTVSIIVFRDGKKGKRKLCWNFAVQVGRKEKRVVV